MVAFTKLRYSTHDLNDCVKGLRMAGMCRPFTKDLETIHNFQSFYPVCGRSGLDFTLKVLGKPNHYHPLRKRKQPVMFQCQMGPGAYSYVSSLSNLLYFYLFAIL